MISHCSLKVAKCPFVPDITWNNSYGNSFQMSDWDKQSKTIRTEKAREATPPALISVLPA